MITYQRETLEESLSEIELLLEAHWKEVAVNKDKIFLNPDFDIYKRMENSGNLAIYTARATGSLIGYFVVVLGVNPHYKDHIFATNDVIYLDPAFRKSMVGSTLITYAEESLKDDGVSVLAINTKTHVPFDNTLKRLDFNHVENVYMKFIGE